MKPTMGQGKALSGLLEGRTYKLLRNRKKPLKTQNNGIGKGEKMAKPKEDCFGFNTKMCKCDALNATYCAILEECNFYKTKEQVEKEKAERADKTCSSYY